MDLNIYNDIVGCSKDYIKYVHYPFSVEDVSEYIIDIHKIKGVSLGSVNSIKFRWLCINKLNDRWLCDNSENINNDINNDVNSENVVNSKNVVNSENVVNP